MNSTRPRALAAALIGLLFLAVSVIYFTRPAGSLPAFLPGHIAGSAHKHVTHGILALALAVAMFVAAWFQSGPKSSAQAR